MSLQYLGEFEQMLLLAILQLDDEAYGARVREVLINEVGREPSAGSLYTTLQRLEQKGLIAASEEGPEARGGRPRRYLSVTADGIAALQRSRAALLALWGPIAGTLDEA